MNLNFKKFSIIFFLCIVCLSGSPKKVSAFACSDLQGIDLSTKSEEDLRQYLIQCEKEKTEIEQNLDSQKQQSSSIQTDIDAITQINNRLQSSIKAQTTVINKLGTDINQKVSTIETLSEKMQSEKDSLAQLIRKINVLDDTSLVNVILSDNSLSDFYKDYDTFSTIQGSLKTSLDTINGVKTETETQKDQLKEKQDAEVDTKAELERNKKVVEQNEAIKKQDLAVSKQQESALAKLVADRAAKSAQIRAKLFALRDTAAIPFGDALDYATAASKATGVRPALVLAILSQESNLGANQGSCYLTNQTTGEGVNSKTGAVIQSVMNPARDVPAFMDITSAVGRDYAKTLVSCPIAGGGYGGAMGPSQFIPATWKLYASRVASALGKKAVDPWNPQDAITATSFLLSDNMKGATGYTAEKNAACRYYSGRACDNKKPANTFYGTSVMAKADDIQTTMIDPLKSI